MGKGCEYIMPYKEKEHNRMHKSMENTLHGRKKSAMQELS
jgi:hypothetical protein